MFELFALPVVILHWCWQIKVSMFRVTSYLVFVVACVHGPLYTWRIYLPYEDGIFTQEEVEKARDKLQVYALRHNRQDYIWKTFRLQNSSANLACNAAQAERSLTFGERFFRFILYILLLACGSGLKKDSILRVFNGIRPRVRGGAQCTTRNSRIFVLRRKILLPSRSLDWIKRSTKRVKIRPNSCTQRGCAWVLKTKWNLPYLPLLLLIIYIYIYIYF